MRKLLTAMALGCFLAVSMPAQALQIITPGLEILSGNQTAQGGPNGIDHAIASTILGSSELYKQEVKGDESGPLADSYETLFFDTPSDPSGATIRYAGGNIVDDTIFLLVKDGNNRPAWYLFDLTSLGWNGTDLLELRNFWPDQGGISHVTLYGISTSPPAVPEPGTLLLLGGGLIGLAAYGRRRKKE